MYVGMLVLMVVVVLKAMAVKWLSCILCRYTRASVTLMVYSYDNSYVDVT